MKTAAQHALEVESAFLAGAAGNFKMAAGRIIAGSNFKYEEFDQGEKLRAAMIDRRMYDRDRYSRLPQGRGMVMRGFERRFLFGKRLKSITTASVLAPPTSLLEDPGNAPPVSLSELQQHLRGLIKDVKAPQLIAVCSPSGFEENVYNTPLEMPNVQVVLVSPRAEGSGWKVVPGSRKIDERLIKVFDPEDVMAKLARVKKEIADRSIDLLTGGISVDSIARRMEVPRPLVQNAFEQVAKTDPELQVSRKGSDWLLFRGAPVISQKEDTSMSLAEWIKSLFSNEGDEAKKINVLSERRAALSGRLDRMYDDIGKLEKREADLTAEGKSTASKVSKRRIAAQISHMRKDIVRCNTSAAILSKQINVISTHIHNLELARTGSVAEMPTSEELTEAAVNAEEILEQLSASDELVSSLEVGMAQTAVSDDEAEILRELEGETADAQKEKSPGSQAKVADASAPSRTAEKGKAQAE